MKVRATALCFVGGARRRPGDVFEVSAGMKSKHFEPVGAAEKPAKPKKEEAKEPSTFSEISKTLPTPKGADLI